MYNKLALNIFALFTVLSSVTSQNANGKALYFLQNPSIEGDPPKLNDGYQDPYAVDSGAAHKVLFGHYSAIIENRYQKSTTNSEDSLLGRSLNDKLVTEANKISKLSKVIEIYRKNLYLTLTLAVNITTSSKTKEFESQLESCRTELKRCDELGDEEISCGVKCLGQGNDVFNGLTALITSLVGTFCSPIDTVFDKFFEVKGKLKHPTLRQYWLFLKRFEETKRPWIDVAAQGTASLVPVIIDRIKTNMMPFRLINQKLVTELKAEELLHPEANSTSIIVNSLCANVDDADIAEDLLDVLYRDAALIDVILGGLSSMNLVSKYLPGRFQVPFAASVEAVRIMTGSVCGLIGFAESGQVPKCDQIGGFPVPGVPLPNIPEMPILNQECLEGSTVNAPEKQGDTTTTDAKPETVVPPAGRKKRNVLPKNKATFGNVDGVNGRENKLQLDSSGLGEVRKRSLVVGERKRSMI